MNDSKRMYVTQLHREFECDTFFPAINKEIFSLQKPIEEYEIVEEKGIPYQFLVYERK